VDPGYRLAVAAADLRLLGLPANRQPRVGIEVHCLAVLALRETGTTANLLGPIVINLKNLKAVQAVAQAGGYSHQQVLSVQETAAACS